MTTPTEASSCLTGTGAPLADHQIQDFCAVLGPFAGISGGGVAYFTTVTNDLWISQGCGEGTAMQARTVADETGAISNVGTLET